jgi:hypothetical protein
MELHAGALRVSDPVPMMLVQLQAIPGLGEHCSVLYTLLSELYSNALEHGVLRLSSSMKAGLDGLDHYLAARERGLAELCDGWVKITAECTQWQGGGKLVLHTQDSGPGFDWRALPTQTSNEPQQCGMHLLRGLCAEVGFEGQGNHAYAVYRWGSMHAANDPRAAA